MAAKLYHHSFHPFDPAKPTVLLIHPAWMDSRFFDETLEQLSALNSSIKAVNYVTVDLNGHGKTIGKGRAQFTIWEQTEDLVGVLDELKVDKAIVVGMSLGGMVALHMAFKYPSRISGLALLASCVTKASPAVQSYFKDLLAVWTSTPRPTEEVMNTAITGWGGVGDDTKAHLNSDRAKLIKERWVASYSGLERVQPVLDCYFTAEDLTSRLGEIQVPVLIVHGTEDTTFPFSEAEIIRDGLVNAKSKRLVPIEGSGHLILGMRKGEDVIARLEEFVTEITQ